MDELSELRKKKLAELQNQTTSHLQAQFAHEEKVAQQIAYLESIVKPKLTKDALIRYGTIKTVHPEKAAQVMMVLAQYVDKIDVITDVQFKEVLLRMEQPKRETTIKRV